MESLLKIVLPATPAQLFIYPSQVQLKYLHPQRMV